MFSPSTAALMCNDVENGLNMFGQPTRMAMQADVEIHRRKFGLGGQGAVNWPQLWAAVEALMPTLLTLFAAGTLNVSAIPAVVAAVVTIIIDLFTGVPVPVPTTQPPS